MGDFHEHWHLHTAIELPLIDPRDIILEPSVVRARGRPQGSTNRVNQNSSTRRDPSGFERVLSQEQRGRGQGRGHDHEQEINREANETQPIDETCQLELYLGPRLKA